MCRVADIHACKKLRLSFPSRGMEKKRKTLLSAFEFLTMYLAR
jgi:hypothetical protein